MDDSDGSYYAPPPFAPPIARVAPLNEQAMLGYSTYPGAQPGYHPQGYYPPAAAFGPPPGYAPVAWHPGTAWPGSGDWQAGRHDAARRGVRRRTVFVAGAVVAALVAIVAVLLTAQATANQRSLSLPDSAAGYDRMSTVTGGQLSSLFGSNGTFGSIPPDDLQHAKVAVYGHPSDAAPSLIFVGFDSASPTIRQQLRDEDSAQVTSDVLAGAGPSVPPLAVDAGPLGGSLKCATVSEAGIAAAVGVWADHDTLGIVLLFDRALTPSREQTGAITRDFRGAAER